jgi:hypothetical protein
MIRVVDGRLIEKTKRGCVIAYYAKHTKASAPSVEDMLHIVLVQSIVQVPYVSQPGFLCRVSESPSRAPPTLS